MAASPPQRRMRMTCCSLMTADAIPSWTWDEEVLALDLFVRIGTGSPTHPEVQELSTFLRQLEIHETAAQNARFRNPNSVARKLADIQTHRPGYQGRPTKGSKLDRALWEYFGNRLDEVAPQAELIRSVVENHVKPADDEEEVGFLHPEGRFGYRLHRYWERDRQIRTRKIKSVLRAHGRLLCEACEEVPTKKYGEIGNEILECHHLIPLAVTGPTNTSLKDVALLCPTCHRVVHRTQPCTTVEQLRAQIVGANG